MILKENKSFVGDPIYMGLEAAILTRRKAIQYPSLLKHRVYKILPFVLQNITEAFDVTGVRYLESNSSITIFPVYDSSFQNTQSTILACQKQRKWIIEQCRGKNEYESALRVHNLLAQNVRYADKGANSHTIVGPLLFQTAVCDGFAKAYKYILDSLNIPCCVVRGFAQEPLTKKRSGHTWNMAFLSQTWSHIDVTFDTTIMANGKLRYDYFGLNTGVILRDHQFNQETIRLHQVI